MRELAPEDGANLEVLPTGLLSSRLLARILEECEAIKQEDALTSPALPSKAGKLLHYGHGSVSLSRLVNQLEFLFNRKYGATASLSDCLVLTLPAYVWFEKASVLLPHDPARMKEDAKHKRSCGHFVFAKSVRILNGY